MQAIKKGQALTKNNGALNAAHSASINVGECCEHGAACHPWYPATACCATAVEGCDLHRAAQNMAVCYHHYRFVAVTYMRVGWWAGGMGAMWEAVVFGCMRVQSARWW